MVAQSFSNSASVHSRPRLCFSQPISRQSAQAGVDRLMSVGEEEEGQKRRNVLFFNGIESSSGLFWFCLSMRVNDQKSVSHCKRAYACTIPCLVKWCACNLAIVKNCQCSARMRNGGLHFWSPSEKLSLYNRFSFSVRWCGIKILPLFSGTCPEGLMFAETSTKCYTAKLANFANAHVTQLNLGLARKTCLAASLSVSGTSASTVLATISSGIDQEAVEKAIRQSAVKTSSNIWTAIQVKLQTLPNGNTYWLDSMNNTLPFENFAADREQPAASTTSCVVLSRNGNFTWNTVKCTTRTGTAALCQTSKGEEDFQFFTEIYESKRKGQSVSLHRVSRPGWSVLRRNISRRNVWVSPKDWTTGSWNTALRNRWGLCAITSWYPNFNGSHFGLPPSEIHRMTGLRMPPKIVWTMTYSFFCPFLPL